MRVSSDKLVKEPRLRAAAELGMGTEQRRAGTGDADNKNRLDTFGNHCIVLLDQHRLSSDEEQNSPGSLVNRPYTDH